ncbi:MAG: hypothetical protein U1E14_13670 [Geminicoccaceae bacterium]
MPRLRPALVLLLLCGPAAAQEFAPSELGEMQRPLGFAAQADLWRPIAGQRDRNGNRTSVRRGQASALAAGNVLNVSVQGSGNTVVVTSEQTSKGSNQATLVLNGSLDLAP